MTMSKGLLLILSGPSGSGKDTLLDSLSQKNKNVQLSISMTTRKQRENETDGIHYYFVDNDYFEERLRSDRVLESAVYSGQYYGTPKDPVDEWLNEGKTVILKIEVNGAQKIRELYPDVVAVFLMPPSMEILEERLRRRETDDEDDIIRRMEISKAEIARAKDYDYIVFNDILENAVDNISAIIKAEELKSDRIIDKVREVMENA